MKETIRPCPENQVNIESTKTRITRKYILPLVITFSLGLAATATVGEVYSIVNWDKISEETHERRERYGKIRVDDTNDGKWPDAPDVGLLTLIEGGVIGAAGAYFGKRKLDKTASVPSSQITLPSHIYI